MQKIYFEMIKCQSGMFNTLQPKNGKVSFILEELYFDLILFTSKVIVIEKNEGKYEISICQARFVSKVHL